MPRQEGQKTKILALLRLLERKTDENHLLTVPAMITALEADGITAERKSLYNDIDALKQAGYDIEQRRGRAGGYYMASRSFQLAELKVLVDAVQSSKFITKKKSRELIKKLEGLASQYQASALQRQVFVFGRAKNQNETGYYAVNNIYEAIAADKMISFRYEEWTLDKVKRPRRDGKVYKVSPWALAWENDSYYLIAYQDYDAPAGIRHYRVDHMINVTTLNTVRAGKKLYAAFDLAAYVKRHFNMYASQDVQNVTLRCENKIVGVLLDRFGTDVTLCPEDDGQHFHLTVPIAVSPQFFGWVCGLAPKVEVTGPPSVRTAMAQHAAALAKLHQQ